jgi:hypothetical protein
MRIDWMNKAVQHTGGAKGICRFEMHKDNAHLGQPPISHSYIALCTILIFLAYFWAIPHAMDMISGLWAHLLYLMIVGGSVSNLANSTYDVSRKIAYGHFNSSLPCYLNGLDIKDIKCHSS